MSRVSVANPYDLLADENEDRTNVAAPPKPKEQKPKAPAAPATTAKPAASKPTDNKPKAAAPAAAPAKSAPKPQQAGGQSPAPRDANTNLEEKSKEYRPRGQGGDKRDRPNKPPVGRDNKNRPFDRKSGTGRPANENKKGGQGKGNWGGDVDPKEAAEAVKDAEAKPEEKEPVEGEEKVTVEGEKKEGEEGEKKEGEEGEKKEDKPAPPPELGLDEYLAKLKNKAPKVEAFKPRTVSNEGFEGLTAINKDEEDGLAPTAGKKAKKDVKKPAAKKDDKEKGQDASNLLAFPSWQEISAQQRKNENREKYGNSRPPRDGDRERRPPRDGPRGPKRENSNRGPKDAAPAQAAPTDFVSKKDFPSLAPGVKA